MIEAKSKQEELRYKSMIETQIKVWWIANFIKSHESDHSPYNPFRDGSKCFIKESKYFKNSIINRVLKNKLGIK